jgi:FixJ family two-component response regulator
MSKPEEVIFVVDDEESMRKALSRLLAVVGYSVETFASAEEVLVRGRPQGPACLVSDLKMPGLTGLELQERLASQGISIPIIFITGHGDIPSSVQAMKEGAVDFLTKPFDGEVLLAAIRRALAHDAEDLKQRDDVRNIRERAARLTVRERQVMELVVTGMLNKQIAYDLGMSEKTVKVHRGRAMAKMEVSSVAELVRLVDRLRQAGYVAKDQASQRPVST